MKQRINIYLGALALGELNKLAQTRGCSRGALVEDLVLGARDVETRLKALEAGHIIKDLGRAEPEFPPGDPVVEKIEEAP